MMARKSAGGFGLGFSKKSKKKGICNLLKYLNKNCEIVFVVCPLRTIFGMKEGAHVHLKGWKHGNRDTELNMACTQ